MILHTGGHKCSKCGNCFRSPSEMARHNCEATLKKRSETVVKTGVAVAECPKCGMRFGTMHAFRRHKVSHTDQFKCGSCQMSFSTDPNHKEKSEDCKKAGSIREARIKRSRLLYSAPKEAIKQTKRNTPGVAVAECRECGMRFGTERAFIRHKVSHTDKFKCDSCQIGFSTDRRHKKEDCKKVGKFREAQIKRSRLLYSEPKILIDKSEKNTIE